jgi:hypothetical protein
MIERIISGGQTGADRAALDAAIACGFPHGGWCPKGRTAEDGIIPPHYRLEETAGASYLARTEKNVKASDGTVAFTMGEMGSGTARTRDFAGRHRKPCLHLALHHLNDLEAERRVRAFVAEHAIKTLNVAGSSASREPEVHTRVFTVIRRVLAEEEAG